MSMKPIWVVTGRTGEGRACYHWIVGYHTDRKIAEKVRGAAQAVASLKFRSWMGDQAASIEELTNPFDPHMVIEPPGVTYCVDEINPVNEEPQDAEDDEQGNESPVVVPRTPLHNLLQGKGSS